ncbi:hypothetical protein [Singulisphaera sp. PoT]|uniref:hypothetical protein n=1 Tax=Singulisphaera sp. PoT TaxID=3411797 RepID=UPI003BF4EE26
MNPYHLLAYAAIVLAMIGVGVILSRAFTRSAPMTPRSASVELHPAYAWSCDECGRDNYATAIVRQLGKDELDELIEQTGIEAIACGMIGHPSRVRCVHCGCSFQTEVGSYIS